MWSMTNCHSNASDWINFTIFRYDFTSKTRKSCIQSNQFIELGSSYIKSWFCMFAFNQHIGDDKKWMPLVNAFSLLCHTSCVCIKFENKKCKEFHVSGIFEFWLIWLLKWFQLKRMLTFSNSYIVLNIRFVLNNIGKILSLDVRFNELKCLSLRFWVIYMPERKHILSLINLLIHACAVPIALHACICHTYTQYTQSCLRWNEKVCLSYGKWNLVNRVKLKDSI